MPYGYPGLRTERLVLRGPGPGGRARRAGLPGDPRVQRFNDEPLRDVAAAEAFIRFLRADSASDARRHWAITADEEVVGLIGLHAWQHDHRRAELGYDMAVSRWGQGIASEAARAVIDYGFTEMKLHRIQAQTIADNHRSVRLLERLGFHREGTLREYSMEDDLTFHDSAVYGLLAADR